MRKVTIIFATLQKREVLEGNFTTMQEVFDVLEDRGYNNLSSFSYIERYTRNRYTQDSDLPESVNDRSGNPTTDLIFSASSNEKYENGNLTRAELYELVKRHNLQETIKEKEGKNYTMVSNEVLLTYIPVANQTTSRRVASPTQDNNLETRVLTLEERVKTLEDKLDYLEFAAFPEGLN